MKKANVFALTASALLGLGTAVGSAQDYFLTADDYPAIGVQSVLQTDTTGTLTVTIGPAGQNQTWVFTQTLKGKTIPYNIVAPAQATHGAAFAATAGWAVQTKQWLTLEKMDPILPVAVHDYFDLEYFEKLKSDTIQWIGVGTVTPFYTGGFGFSKPATNYVLPLSYTKRWLKKGTYTAPTKFVLWGFQVDINVEMKDSTWVDVDGTGKLTIPLGTYDCVRLKLKRLLSLRALYGQTPLYARKDTLIQYEWYTKKAGLILQVTSRGGETNDNFTQAKYLARLSSTNAAIGSGCDPDCPSSESLPSGYTLEPNFPNPFNPSTRIPYRLATPAVVDIRVYSLLGLEVAVLESGYRTPGRHLASWDGTDLKGRPCPGALYLCRMKAVPATGGPAVVQTVKMLLAD